jgi:hypothetical protein
MEVLIMPKLKPSHKYTKPHIQLLNTFKHLYLVKRLDKKQIIKEMRISLPTYYRLLLEALEPVKDIPVPPYTVAANTLMQLQTTYRSAVIQYHNSTNDREKIRLLRLQSRLAIDILRVKLSTINKLSEFDKEYRRLSKALDIHPS